MLSNPLTGQFYGLTLEYTPTTSRLQRGSTVKVRIYVFEIQFRQGVYVKNSTQPVQV